MSNRKLKFGAAALFIVGGAHLAYAQAPAENDEEVKCPDASGEPNPACPGNSSHRRRRHHRPAAAGAAQPELPHYVPPPRVLHAIAAGGGVDDFAGDTARGITAPAARGTCA
jgi:hypothetical protein